jgi:hypothetical protein
MAVRRAFLGLLSGALWGAVARWLSRGAIGSPVMGGVFASPFIGLVVALAYRDWPRFPRAWRIGLALASLYLAAALFGLGVGLQDVSRDLSTVQAHRIASAVVLQSVIGVLWGLTMLGYFVVLWPLAYVNHALIGRLTRE